MPRPWIVGARRVRNAHVDSARAYYKRAKFDPTASVHEREADLKLCRTHLRMARAFHRHYMQELKRKCRDT